MVMKMNQKVEFCGKERRFKRCPNKTLKDYQKSIEDIQDQLIPLAERTRDYQFKLTELTDEIEAINKHIELLERLDDATDKEIRECIDLTKQKIVLQKEIHQLRVNNDEIEKEDKNFYDQLDAQLRGSYGEFASLIFEDFDPSEIEEAHSTDLTIAPRLSELYRLATTDVKQKEIDKAYQKIIKDSFR